LLIQLAASPITGLISTVADPKSPTGQSTVIVRTGNDPALTPETARNWSIGATWQPSSVHGLKLEATYFNIDFTNRVGSPANFTVMLQQESIYSALIVRNPTVAQVNALQSDPKFGSTPVDPTKVAAVLDIRSRNEAEQAIDGIDLSATLTRPAFGGNFTVMVSGTRLLNDRIAIAPGAPLNQFLDNAFYPTAWKTRSSLGWEGGGVSVAAFLNWQNGYAFVTTTGSTPIHSFTTVDLSANVDFEKFGLHALRGTKLTAAVQNLTNAAPPFLNVAGGYDAVNASALGRFATIRITHAW
jgi:iron complex outermembrane receptor protein